MLKTERPSSLPERHRLKCHYEANHPAYEAALAEVQREIRHLLEGQGFTPTIKYRIKRFDPLYAKLRKLHARQRKPEAKVTDLFGLRIICPFLEDIETVERLLTDNFDVSELERKGGRHTFREFGYDSVHLLIHLEQKFELPPRVAPACEIQLRTILQDAWAEVEHELVYKSDIALPNESIRRKLASLNATLTLSDLIFQEIRDYQKELRRLGNRRRASLIEKFDLHETIPLELSTGSPPAASGKTPPPSRASRLEKTMLSALDAHTNQDYREAIVYYNQLLGMRLARPVRSLVYNHRGMAWFALGELRKSLADFDKAVAFDSEYSRGYINRGLCRRALKQPEQAVEDFDCALQIDPERVEAWLGRAQTHYELNSEQQALEDCEQAIRIDPDCQPAQELKKLLLNRDR